MPFFPGAVINGIVIVIIAWAPYSAGRGHLCTCLEMDCGTFSREINTGPGADFSPSFYADFPKQQKNEERLKSFRNLTNKLSSGGCIDAAPKYNGL